MKSRAVVFLVALSLAVCALGDEKPISRGKREVKQPTKEAVDQARAKVLSMIARTPEKYGIRDVSKDVQERVDKTRLDRDDWLHMRFQALFEGVPIMQGEFVGHIDPSGNVSSISGGAGRVPELRDAIPSITEDQAIDFAKNSLPAGTKVLESSATLWVVMKGEFTPQDVLAWGVALSLPRSRTQGLLVDAKTGTVLVSQDTTAEAAAAYQGGWLLTLRPMYCCQSYDAHVDGIGNGSKFLLQTDLYGTYGAPWPTSPLVYGNSANDAGNHETTNAKVFSSTVPRFGDGSPFTTNRETAGAAAFFYMVEVWTYPGFADRLVIGSGDPALHALEVRGRIVVEG